MQIADKLFKDNINKIINGGSWDKGPRPHYADGTPANTKFITQVFETYDISKGELPLTSLRPVPIKSAIREMLWIYQEQSNDLSVLRNKYNITWWDDWESKDMPGTIGARYGWTLKKTGQVQKLLSQLKANPYSRRHIITMWNIEDFDTTDGLYPCAYETLWSVRDGFLDMTLVQRSSDYLTAGHVNKIQYVALQMMVARDCGLMPGKFSHFVENLHIYDRHLEQAQILLDRIPDEQSIPRLILNPEKTDFFSITEEDFTLEQYSPVRPNLKFELAI